MTLRAFSSYGFEVNGKLTLRVAITGVKRFAITGAALDQMARPALGACNCCFVRFIDKFGMSRILLHATGNLTGVKV